MALIVEDGTGLANAESYISVADADTYHSNFGHAAWTGTDAVKEAALRNATQYIDVMFGRQWQGRQLTEAQALDWPRYSVVTWDGWAVSSTIVPAAVERATAELALHALTEELVPNVATPGSVTGYSVKVGPISEATTYSGRNDLKMYTLAKKLLIEFLLQGTGVSIGRE